VQHPAAIRFDRTVSPSRRVSSATGSAPVIDSARDIPYLLILFGVLGGISAFGFVGLFLGPIVIVVLLAVWREWAKEQALTATNR